MSAETNSQTIRSDARDPNAYPINQSLYRMEGPVLEFWQAQTGIQDEEELKRHILAVQAEAYQIFAYQCIRLFSFTRARVVAAPNYDEIVKLGKERDGAIFLDVGCCFGTDMRKIVADGWPLTNIIGTDLHAEFFDLGHKLFRSNKETFPVTFLAGDLMDPVHLAVNAHLSTPPVSPAPALAGLTSLNPLHGHVSVIHAGALFHLFTEEEQTTLARGLAGLLSPLPGSRIVGSHVGAETKGMHVVMQGRDGSKVEQFHHSAESWKALWDGEVFEKGSVKVDVNTFVVDMRPYMDKDDGSPHTIVAIVWSVIKL